MSARKFYHRSARPAAMARESSPPSGGGPRSAGACEVEGRSACGAALRLATGRTPVRQGRAPV